MRACVGLLLWCFSALAVAAIDPVDFSQFEPEQAARLQARYHELNTILRCPKCQNQNIAGSNAPIASDMRRKVRQLLADGKTDTDIEQYMVERYGEFASYRPPVVRRTYFLWFGPLLFLFIMIGGFLTMLRLSRRNSQSDVQSEKDGEIR